MRARKGAPDTGTPPVRPGPSGPAQRDRSAPCGSQPPTARSSLPAPPRSIRVAKHSDALSVPGSIGILQPDRVGSHGGERIESLLREQDRLLESSKKFGVGYTPGRAAKPSGLGDVSVPELECGLDGRPRGRLDELPTTAPDRHTILQNDSQHVAIAPRKMSSTPLQ